MFRQRMRTTHKAPWDLNGAAKGLQVLREGTHAAIVTKSESTI